MTLVFLIGVLTGFVCAYICGLFYASGIGLSVYRACCNRHEEIMNLKKDD